MGSLPSNQRWTIMVFKVVSMFLARTSRYGDTWQSISNMRWKSPKSSINGSTRTKASHSSGQYLSGQSGIWKSLSTSEVKNALDPLIDCLCSVSNTRFHLTLLRRQELKSSVASIFRNLYDSTNNTVDMQCLLDWDMTAKIKEFAKEHKLSQSISARLYPYQRLSASLHQIFLDAARSWKNSRSHSNYLNLTSHGSHQQLGHQTVDRPISFDMYITNLNPGTRIGEGARIGGGRRISRAQWKCARHVPHIQNNTEWYSSIYQWVQEITSDFRFCV